MTWLNIKSSLHTFWLKNTYRLKNRPIRELEQVVFKENFNTNSFWKRWNNGWYVNGGGNDNRKNYNFDKSNVEPTGNQLNLYSRYFETGSGCMIYSKKEFTYGIFRFKLTLSSFNEEEFAFWLKSYSTDINEIDNLEVFMDGNTNHPLLFTAHSGTKYGSRFTHKFFPTTLRKRVRYSTPTTFDLEWRENKIMWYVNGIPVKVWYGKTPEVPLGIIINYGKIHNYSATTLASISEIKVAKKFSEND